MMSDIKQTKQQFIDSAILSSKALAEGNTKVANKHAKILKKILENIEKSNIDKNMLVELLEHEDISVRVLAAIDLLRIRHEVHRAQGTLEKIVAMDQSGEKTDEKLRIMAADIQLKNWKDKGFVFR